MYRDLCSVAIELRTHFAILETGVMDPHRQSRLVHGRAPAAPLRLSECARSSSPAPGARRACGARQPQPGRRRMLAGSAWTQPPASAPDCRSPHESGRSSSNDRDPWSWGTASASRTVGARPLSGRQQSCRALASVRAGWRRRGSTRSVVDARSLLSAHGATGARAAEPSAG
jgi:hypothetical protein